MSYRVLCDENVPERTVTQLERAGIDAFHVTETLEPGASDTLVAAHAQKHGALLMTNDDDFLDGNRYPDTSVLYYPDNAASAHDLARRVGELASLVPDPDDLGRVTFLTER